jgi:hypothetical protein
MPSIWYRWVDGQRALLQECGILMHLLTSSHSGPFRLAHQFGRSGVR